MKIIEDNIINKLKKFDFLIKCVISINFLVFPFTSFALFCSLQNGIRLTYHNRTDEKLYASVFLLSGVKDIAVEVGKDQKGKPIYGPPASILLEPHKDLIIQKCTDTDFDFGVSIGPYNIIAKKGTSGPDWNAGLGNYFNKYLIGSNEIKTKVMLYSTLTWRWAIYSPYGKTNSTSQYIDNWDKRGDCDESTSNVCYSVKVENCNGEVNTKCDEVGNFYINSIPSSSFRGPLGKY